MGPILSVHSRIGLIPARGRVTSLEPVTVFGNFLLGVLRRSGYFMCIYFIFFFFLSDVLCLVLSCVLFCLVFCLSL